MIQTTQNSPLKTMLTQPATEHTISYANRTSANAVKFGYGETGCAIVVTDVDSIPKVFGMVSEAEAYVSRLGTSPSSLSLDNPLHSENLAKAHFDGLLTADKSEARTQNERPHC